MKKLDYYAGMMKESYSNDKERMRMYSEIDKHIKGQWKPSSVLSALPWIQGHNFSSTQPADAVDAGARTFATLMPKIAVAPLADNPAEYERAEMFETALDWHMKRMNMWGKKTTHWQILESSMRYCSVAFETEYLPFVYKGREKDKRIKQLLNGSHFRWTVHHPSTVHPYFSKYGLESVCLAKPVSLQDVIKEYGEDNEGVQKVLMKQFNGKKPDAAKLMTAYFTLCKAVDWDETCVWLIPNSGMGQVNNSFDSKDEYVVLHEEHGLDFIPWVIADNEDPILKNAVNTGLLDNLNNLRLMSFAAAVALVASSQQWIATPDGTLRAVHIDNKNPTQPLVTDQTVKVQPLEQQRPNDAIENKVQQASQELSSTTVAQILTDANRLAGNENFSTANMAFQIALGSLALARDVAERAEEQGFYQMFQWIDHAGDKPLVAYREKSKRFNEVEMPQGQEIVIKKGEFDTSALYIDVKLKEFSQMDEQAKWNLAITQVERMGMSRQVIAEELGVENYALHEQKRAVEDLTMARVQLMIQEKQMDLQNQKQMEAMQAQQAAMQPPPSQPQNGVQDMNADFGLMQGADMRGGGLPAQPANPGENRVQIQGQDAGGVPLV